MEAEKDRSAPGNLGGGGGGTADLSQPAALQNLKPVALSSHLLSLPIVGSLATVHLSWVFVHPGHFLLCASVHTIPSQTLTRL